MTAMLNRLVLVIVFFGLYLALTGCGADKESKPAPIADSDKGYAARIRIYTDEQEKVGAFYYEKGKYRIEFPGDSILPILIVDENENLNMAIFPGARRYEQTPLDDQRNIMSDLFQGVKWAAQRFEVEDIGVDTFYGIPCIKQMISQDTVGLYARWVSEDYPFPLRIEEYTRYERKLELFAVRKKVLGDLYFAIPEDYTNIASIRMADSLDTSLARNRKPDTVIVRTIPVDELLSSKQMLHVPLDPSREVTVSFKNGASFPSSCKIAFYRNGKVLSENENGPRNYGTVTVKQTGMRTSNTWKAYADRFEVMVERGMMFIEVTQPEG